MNSSTHGRLSKKTDNVTENGTKHGHFIKNTLTVPITFRRDNVKSRNEDLLFLEFESLEEYKVIVK